MWVIRDLLKIVLISSIIIFVLVEEYDLGVFHWTLISSSLVFGAYKSIRYGDTCGRCFIAYCFHLAIISFNVWVILENIHKINTESIIDIILGGSALLFFVGFTLFTIYFAFFKTSSWLEHLNED